MTTFERRYTFVPVEMRGDAKAPRIGGYAAKFDKLSRNLGGFVEKIAPSFFNQSRGNGWPGVVARYNHEDMALLGTTGAGTLRLSIDDIGLVYEVDPPASRADVVELVGRGDVRQSSFAFRLGADGDEWGLTDQNYPVRTLVTGQLVDVAPVNTPAYPDTTSGLRSLAEHMGAEFDEVRKLAEDNELRRFFIRTDNVGPAKGLFGAAAAAQLLARRTDPYE